MGFFNKKPDRWQLQETADEAMLNFDHRLTDTEGQAIADLMQLAQDRPDQPINVYIGGQCYTITKEKVYYIKG